MSTAYHTTGAIAAAFFALTLVGIWEQIKLIWRRKRDYQSGTLPQRPTAIISLNQQSVSFFAYWSFFVYGVCVEEFNHYLVWTRLGALLLMGVILWEICFDRRDWPSRSAFVAYLVLTLGAISMLFFDHAALSRGKEWFQLMIVAITVILAQGYIHQMILIRRQRSTGGVSKRTHQLIFLKDLSGIAFGIAMGWRDGWPVVLLSFVSACTKLGVLWQFRWVRANGQGGAKS